MQITTCSLNCPDLFQIGKGVCMPAEIDVLSLQVFHLPLKSHGLHHRAVLLFRQRYCSRFNGLMI